MALEKERMSTLTEQRLFKCLEISIACAAELAALLTWEQSHNLGRDGCIVVFIQRLQHLAFIK